MGRRKRVGRLFQSRDKPGRWWADPYGLCELRQPRRTASSEAHAGTGLASDCGGKPRKIQLGSGKVRQRGKEANPTQGVFGSEGRTGRCPAWGQGGRVHPCTPVPHGRRPFRALPGPAQAGGLQRAGDRPHLGDAGALAVDASGAQARAVARGPGVWETVAPFTACRGGAGRE